MFTGNGGVEIQISNGFLFQIVSELLSPLSRTDEAILFRIPTAKNDRASWLPTLLQQLTKATAQFQHRRCTAVWIDRAEHPRITMIPEHHPTILFLVAVDARNDVPDLSDLVIHVRLQTHFDVVGAAGVISERQAALKTTGSHWSFELDQYRPGDVIRDRLHGNVREIRRLFRFQTSLARDRRTPRR